MIKSNASCSIIEREMKSTLHENVRIRSFLGPYFPSFGLNTDQKNSEVNNCSEKTTYSVINLPSAAVFFGFFLVV